MTTHSTTTYHNNKFEPQRVVTDENTLQISDVIGIIPANSLPHQFEIIDGMGAINFQGKVIPIVDLRMNLSLKPDDCAEQICILVMETTETAESFMLAVLVDSEMDAYQLVMDTTH